ncbi:MAG: hypothetical protein OXI80_09035 [Caldilineaceae bacterium]|nr:hypothetical protein [Caldilineaceae bacterium]MDE0337801.1 hypothetical protein [Caldilineaceae bacterium]
MEIVAILQLVLLLSLIAAAALLFCSLRDVRRLLDKYKEDAATKA